MPDTNIVIYISENNPDCESVLHLMDNLDVSYEVKNITKHNDYRREMQDLNIYGTPATFIGADTIILGAQVQAIKRELGY